ncbi:putative xylose transporter [Klebsiella michiganensis]|nr:putative xylose transporter [Klebsiella michiganensis]
MMTRASWERDMLSITRMSMSPFGRILAVACTLPLVKYFGDDQAAWIKTMSIWAFLALLLLLFCFYKCEEKVVIKAREKQGNVPVKTQLSALFRNQYFWASAILWTAQSVYYTVVGIALPYYCRYVLGDDTFYSSIFVAETACIIIFTFLSSVPIRKYGKRNVALCGIVLATIGQVLFMFNSDDYHWALANAIIRGIGFAPLNAVLFGFCGDAVEFGQWKTRVRQEGMIFSAGSVGTKLGAGIAAAVISGLLSMAGYVSSSSGSGVQPQSAIDMINHVYLYGSFFLWIVVIITLLFYRLDKQYPQIMHDLKEREARGEM